MRLIDADELIEQLTPPEDALNNGAKLLLAVFVDAVKAFPTIDAAPVVHGEWQIEFGKSFMSCSECGFCVVRLAVFSYCPACGARMDGRREDGET